MKPPRYVHPSAPVTPDPWRTHLIYLVIVVALGSILVFAQPVSMTVVAQTNSPTDTYGCSGRYHTVKSGETLRSIAARYDSTTYRIKSCNGLRTSSVRVGQRLLIPIRSSSSGSWLEGIEFAKDAPSVAPVISAEMAAP